MATTHDLWGYSGLELWPLTTKMFSVLSRVHVDTWAKFEEIISRCSWDTADISMEWRTDGWTDNPKTRLWPRLSAAWRLTTSHCLPPSWEYHFFTNCFVHTSAIYGSALTKCSKTWNFLVLHHHVLSARPQLVTSLHINGSLEAHNVTALLWKATVYYEAVLDVTSTVKLTLQCSCFRQAAPN